MSDWKMFDKIIPQPFIINFTCDFFWYFFGTVVIIVKMISSIISRRLLYLKQKNILMPFTITTSVKRAKFHTNLLLPAAKNKRQIHIESMYRIPSNINCCVRHKYTKGSAKDDVKL